MLALAGVLYVEVPDATRYREFLVAPFQDFNTEHINHFSHRSLANLLGLFGVSAIRQGAKDIFSAPNVPYPALFAFYQTASESSKLPGSITKDEHLRAAIISYIEASQTMMQEMDRKIASLLDREPRIVVWGIGQLAMKLLAETCLASAEIVAFVDNNPINQGKLIAGKPIVTPTTMDALSEPILITTTIHQEAISDTIRNVLRLPNEIVLLR